MVTIRLMTISDYDKVYALWLSCAGMGLNNLDDSREGNFFSRNENGNAFWEKIGFTGRDDLVYRNRSLADIVRIDT